MKRTPLKRYTPLKRKTPLRAKKGLTRMSDKAKSELSLWMDIKRERIQKLQDKYGYVPCEKCLQHIIAGSELYCAEAHHNNHDRRDNSPQNCRILHRVCNQLVEVENIRDIASLL